MEGFGVTNFSVNQPSYQYTTETTEFDDALIRRGIVAREQALIAKGATPQQAHSLLEMEKQQKEKHERGIDYMKWDQTKNDEDDADEDEEDYDDDEFMQQYRQNRIKEIQQQQEQQQNQKLPRFDQVIPISRPEWQAHVNDASMDGTWVVVGLTSNDTECTGCLERAMSELAEETAYGGFGQWQQETQLPSSQPTPHIVKFVSIPYQSAIPNWPHSNLPTVFLYRFGTLQHQWIQLPRNIDAEKLAKLLQIVIV